MFALIRNGGDVFTRMSVDADKFVLVRTGGYMFFLMRAGKDRFPLLRACGYAFHLTLAGATRSGNKGSVSGLGSAKTFTTCSVTLRSKISYAVQSPQCI